MHINKSVKTFSFTPKVLMRFSLALMFAVSAGLASASELVAKKTADASKLPYSLSTSVSTARLLIQEESQTADRYTSASLKFGYNIFEKTKISLGQGVTYTPEESNGALKREQDDNMQVGVTRLSLAQTLPELGDLSFTTSTSVGFYNSEYYRDQTRETDFDLKATAKWQALDWLGFSLTPAYVIYQHRKKQANDDVGAYVAQDRQSIAAALDIGLYLEGLSASLNYAAYKVEYYGNREDAYSYDTGATLSYAVMDKLSANVGISSSKDQIENDNVAPVVLLNKDLTEVSAGVDYTIF